MISEAEAGLAEAQWFPRGGEVGQMSSKGTVLPGFIKCDCSLMGLLYEIFFVGMCGLLTER